MSEEAFADLKDGLEGALAFERGRAPRLKGDATSGSATAEGNVTLRILLASDLAQLLTSGICDDAEHQPQDKLGSKVERAW